jgi:hypothetical protein
VVGVLIKGALVTLVGATAGLRETDGRDGKVAGDADTVWEVGTNVDAGWDAGVFVTAGPEAVGGSVEGTRVDVGRVMVGLTTGATKGFVGRLAAGAAVGWWGASVFLIGRIVLVTGRLAANGALVGTEGRFGTDVATGRREADGRDGRTAGGTDTIWEVGTKVEGRRDAGVFVEGTRVDVGRVMVGLTTGATEGLVECLATGEAVGLFRDVGLWGAKWDVGCWVAGATVAAGERDGLGKLGVDVGSLMHSLDALLLFKLLLIDVPPFEPLLTPSPVWSSKLLRMPRVSKSSLLFIAITFSFERLLLKVLQSFFWRGSGALEPLEEPICGDKAMVGITVWGIAVGCEVAGALGRNELGVFAAFTLLLLCKLRLSRGILPSFDTWIKASTLIAHIIMMTVTGSIRCVFKQRIVCYSSFYFDMQSLSLG